MSQSAESLKVISAFAPHQSLSAALLDPYFITSTDGTIALCNRKFEDFLNLYNSEDVKGKQITNLFKFSISNTEVKVEELLNPHQQRLDDISYNLYDPSGKSLRTGTVTMSKVPLLNDLGELAGFFFLLRDVTADANLQSSYKDTSHKTITDPLTGLRNRSYLEQYLATHYPLYLRQIAEKSQDYHVCFMMSDIDHFKSINDTYGHQAGDYVIKKMASLLESGVRKTDVLCRYGGEEFIFILIGASVEQAQLVGEKIRKKIESEQFQFGEHTLKVTTSFGISEVVASDIEPQLTIHRADEALYDAKHGGRNCVKVRTFNDSLKKAG